MELKGEQIIKKGKKTSIGIWIAYIIAILVICVAAYMMSYKEKTQTPEAIDFTANGAIGTEVDKYAFLDVHGLTDEVAIYGNTENENDSSNDRYYIVISNGYMYIADLNFDTIEKLKPWQEYLFSEEEEPVAPEPTRIYGMTELIPTELKKYVLDYYNKSVGEEYAIAEADFESYFGSVLLNVRKSPVDTSIETVIIVFAASALIIIFIMHIASIVKKGRNKKYLKKNQYEEELASQLDDYVEDKFYKDKVILTRDFFVDMRKGGFTAIKYSDMKWIHLHDVKYYGVATVSTSIIIHLKDGKTTFECLNINGKRTDEFMEVFAKLCEKTSDDVLKGYTTENINEFREYKKQLKLNKE